MVGLTHPLLSSAMESSLLSLLHTILYQSCRKPPFMSWPVSRVGDWFSHWIPRPLARSTSRRYPSILVTHGPDYFENSGASAVQFLAIPFSDQNVHCSALGPDCFLFDEELRPPFLPGPMPGKNTSKDKGNPCPFLLFETSLLPSRTRPHHTIAITLFCPMLPAPSARDPCSSSHSYPVPPRPTSLPACRHAAHILAPPVSAVRF